jgi:hypothetical protein
MFGGHRNFLLATEKQADQTDRGENGLVVELVRKRML